MLVISIHTYNAILTQTKRGFGHGHNAGGSYGHGIPHGGLGGYGLVAIPISHGHHVQSYGQSYGGGGAAPIAQKAAEQAKAALSSQIPASYQAR